MNLPKLLECFRSFCYTSSNTNRAAIRQAPDDEQQYYAGLGVLVCLISVIAAGAMGSIVALEFTQAGVVVQVLAFVAAAALWGTMIWNIDRAVLGSLPPDPSPREKRRALLLRAGLAAVTATVIAVPAMMHRLGPQIDIYNDGELARLLVDRSRAYREAEGALRLEQQVQQRRASLEKLDQDARTPPFDVQLALSHKDACAAELETVRRDRGARIRYLQGKRREIGTVVAGLPDDVDRSVLNDQIARIEREIGQHRAAISRKDDECAEFGNQAAKAAQNFQLQVSATRGDLMQEIGKSEQALKGAEERAAPRISRSATTISEGTADFSSRLTGFFGVLSDDWRVQLWFVLYWLLFFGIDLTAVGAKLFKKSIYEKRQRNWMRREEAHLDAEAEIAELSARTKAQLARVEAVERARRGSELASAKIEAEKVIDSIRAPFDQHTAFVRVAQETLATMEATKRDIAQGGASAEVIAEWERLYENAHRSAARRLSVLFAVQDGERGSGSAINRGPVGRPSVDRTEVE